MARLWHSGWHEAHRQHVPKALTDLRTETDFARRLRACTDPILTAGSYDAPLGFAIVRGAELYQFFVGLPARGTGFATRLIGAAEDALHTSGVETARLDVIPENARAIRFYERSGWRTAEITEAALDTSAGLFALRCQVMTKTLAPF